MLYIVAPVHNRAAVTAHFLGLLAQQTCQDFTLVLVDDGCTDDTVAIARATLPPSQLVTLTGNGQLWWGGALQKAFEYLQAQRLQNGDAVLITNDDVSFEPDFLTCGLAVLAAHSDACIQAVGIDQDSGAVDSGAFAEVHRLHFRAAEPDEMPNCLSTRGLLMGADTWLRSGGFRPRWLPHYLSDYEFTLRLHRQGVTLMTVPSFHLVTNSATTGDETFDGQGLRHFINRTLSNRAKYNPVHWSALALMVSPRWVAPWLVLRLWLGFARKAMRVALSPDRRLPATEPERNRR
jgi:GT2 family glycosyltransferase